MKYLLPLHLIVLGACSAPPEVIDAPRSTPGGPELILIDTIPLQEMDSLFLAEPVYRFLVDSAGGILVADQGPDRILRWRPDGSLDRAYGRRGKGPGEILGVADFEVTSSMLLVTGYRNTRISAFDLRSGASLGDARYEGRLSTLAASSSGVWFGTMDFARNRTLGRLSPERDFAGGAVLHGSYVPIPEEFHKYPGLDVYNNVPVKAFQSGVLVGFGGLGYLIRVREDGSVADTIHIPARDRRGAPQATLEAVFRTRNATTATAFGSISSLTDFWPTASGMLLVFHRDLRLSNPGVRNSPVVARAYLSLLSPALDRACVDGIVPYPEEGQPRIAVHGDTVYALDQVLVDGTPPRTRTVVRRYRIDDAGCDWRSTRPAN